ncbi:MAG: WD40 repeat domain-containing protein, partial [Pyrinomonadaceae bacterium]
MSENVSPMRNRLLLAASIILLNTSAIEGFGQTPSPTPDTRGLGIQSASSTNTSRAPQQAREAKPELVLQNGYNNLMGATRLVFSPDGRLLATATFRSSSIKLWETATGRELRNLSSGTQSAMGISPYIAFSRDSRLIAAAAGDNSVRIWDVTTGRELQTLAGSQGSLASTMGVSFIGFTSEGRIVTVGDTIKVWDVATGQEVRTLGAASLDVSGFTGGEGGASLSPDGKQLGRVETDATPSVKVWDLATGREVRTVELPNEVISAVEVVFTSDGRLLSSGVVDKQIKLWDLTAKRGERKLGQTTNEHAPLRFSRDGQQLIRVEGYSVRRWNISTGQELPALNVPNSGLSSGEVGAFVGFSEDGKRFASGGFDTPTILWEAETAKQLLKMSGRTNMAYKVRFSADGTQLSSGGRTRWDLRTGRGLRITPGPSDRKIGLPSPDGRLIAAFGLNSNSVSILEMPTGKQLQTLTPGGGGVVQQVDFSPDGAMLVVTYGMDELQRQKPTMGFGQSATAIENQAKIWDVKTGRELRTLMLGHTATEAGFSADGRTVATLGHLGQISLWDTATGNKLRDLTSSPLASLGGLGNMAGMGNLGSLGSISPGSVPGSSPGKSGSKNTKQMPSIPGMPNMADITAMMTNMMGSMSAGTMGRTVTSVAFSPDGKTLATGGVESKSNFDQIISAQMGQAGQKRSRNQQALDPDDFMKNMKVEAIGQVILWDVATGREVGALKGHGKGVTQVAFSRDGNLLASSSSDNSIRIWDVATQRELRTLTGHTTNIDSMDFSPDSRLLASASDDGGTFLWDTKTGEHL